MTPTMRNSFHYKKRLPLKGKRRTSTKKNGFLENECLSLKETVSTKQNGFHLKK